MYEYISVLYPSGNFMTVEALINVLASKGLITRDEVMREIKRLQAEMGKRNN